MTPPPRPPPTDGRAELQRLPLLGGRRQGHWEPGAQPERSLRPGAGQLTPARARPEAPSPSTLCLPLAPHAQGTLGSASSQGGAALPFLLKARHPWLPSPSEPSRLLSGCRRGAAWPPPPAHRHHPWQGPWEPPVPSEGQMRRWRTQRGMIREGFWRRWHKGPVQRSMAGSAERRRVRMEKPQGGPSFGRGGGRGRFMGNRRIQGVRGPSQCPGCRS